ncbi:MAG: hypothetical protein COU08_04415 [Candidatus Harrisonbacteria bacterium CG10_big_fil_rev_8_21_14_0_10_42_17]|uniref:Uncharacterized protein n=1 Tax=Candidatus Harrisonbacteria bacterium CG10_big_fil_rev_8_21_14_0_10_42_17 TaxID=1974584 RepID=A0A2M6WGZ7_9BACT|nr:MAG: hypothetical protein COU08_04415 [Candidatus Harrisonbacteria bacterium CG10_big_fil_rev_8_21_14_0_10_42_17]
MRTLIFIILILGIISLGGFFFLNHYVYTEKQGDGGFQPSYKDVTYVVEGQSVKLVNGYAETEATPGSTLKTVTQYFGNEAEGDLNGDGVSDIAFLLTQDGGGSGTFYYVVAALKTDTGYVGTNAVFLGDRITPQTTEVRDGVLIVNYAVRSEDESFSAPPSVGISTYLRITDGNLVTFVPTTHWKTYDSKQFGLRFLYPETYYLETRELGDGHRGHFSIVLTEDTEENRLLREGKLPGREGPVAITVDLYQSPETLDPVAWMKGFSFSNFKLSDGEYEERIVADKPAVSYSWDGLYQGDSVVVSHQDYVALFSVTHLTPYDPIRSFFSELMNSVLFY